MSALESVNSNTVGNYNSSVPKEERKMQWGLVEKLTTVLGCGERKTFSINFVTTLYRCLHCPILRSGTQKQAVVWDQY